MKIISFLFFVTSISYAQIEVPQKYNFEIYDGANLSTMHTFNQNYLSSYRIFSRTLDNISKRKKTNLLIKTALVYIVGMPLTHEEGHRSVLTNLGIGSISQPFFSSKGAAYVKGVTDNTLLNLRNNDLPNYIRLHTGGLEADYSLSRNTDDLLAFKQENYTTIKEEYILRKFSSILYNLTTFIPKLSPNLTEEDNELERDIVGHDIWGMVRHLHRPNMPFYRYTSFDDLTNTEQKYAKKLAWRSLSNLVNPILLGKISYRLNTNLQGNFALSHSLAPFGDYFNQDFWFIYKDKYFFKTYLRENMNNNKTFFAGGISLNNMVINDRLNSTVNIDVWQQPKDLSFTTDVVTLGTNINIGLNYSLFKNKKAFIKNAGIYTETNYKSNGFLPEYASLKEDFGLRFGFSFSY